MLDYCDPLVGWSRSLHPRPQETSPRPDVELTPSETTVVAPMTPGAVFNHCACQKNRTNLLQQLYFRLSGSELRGESKLSR